MNEIKAVKDLDNLIEINEELKKTFWYQKKHLQSVLGHSGPTDISGIDYSSPNIRSTTKLDFAEYIVQEQELDKKISSIERNLEMLRNTKVSLREKLDKLQGLEYKVVYMKDIEGKTLLEISEELNYSYQWIREVYARSQS